MSKMESTKSRRIFSEMPPNVPAPSHRHAAPSGPWPFLDINEEVCEMDVKVPIQDSHLPFSASPCEHAQTPDQEVCWCKYPQALYPNWTPCQQKKSGIGKIIDSKLETSTIHYLDVMDDGAIFVNSGQREVDKKAQDETWFAIQRGRPPGVRVRTLFVDKLSASMLQMLGTRYNIEPFLFSSTIGWIPSRFRTNVVPHESDHITVCLTFIRSINNSNVAPSSSNIINRSSVDDLVIDTEAPLPLRTGNYLLLHDQLALHMVRSKAGNTIISLHPHAEYLTTTASALHSLIQAAGMSVYWNNIFTTSSDPTFVFLIFFWYALYAWDETIERLYEHICFIESEVIATNDMTITQELHVMRAHLHRYQALLEDFRQAVVLVREALNPSLDPSPDSAPDTKFEEMKAESNVLMQRECDNILTEIERLDSSTKLQEKRLRNVMDLGFSMVNFEDSKQMQKMMEASVKDSSATKQIAYLTMVFLPSSFVTSAFGMNISELVPTTHGTFLKFVALTIPLTLLTIWILVAYQFDPNKSKTNPVEDSNNVFHVHRKGGLVVWPVPRLSIWKRLMWPVILCPMILEGRKRKNAKKNQC